MIFSTQSEGTQKSSGMALSNMHTQIQYVCTGTKKYTHDGDTVMMANISKKHADTSTGGKKRIMACQVTNTDLF